MLKNTFIATNPSSIASTDRTSPAIVTPLLVACPRFHSAEAERGEQESRDRDR
jgi:hypothetical protein